MDGQVKGMMRCIQCISQRRGHSSLILLKCFNSLVSQQIWTHCSVESYRWDLLRTGHSRTQILTGHHMICGKADLDCCLRYHRQCEEMPYNDLQMMALDSQLPWPMSSAEPDDEGHYDRLKKVSENCCIHSSKLFTFKYCQLPVTYSDCLKVMSIVLSITTYFSHSNHATHHLKEELKKEKDQRGIQVAGATCFSWFSIHACSISRCLHPIQHCLASGTVKFDTAVVSFFSFLQRDSIAEWNQTKSIWKYLEPWPSQISVGSPQYESTSHPHHMWLGDSWGTKYNLFWCISHIHWYCSEFCGDVFRQR